MKTEVSKRVSGILHSETSLHFKSTVLCKSTLKALLMVFKTFISTYNHKFFRLVDLNRGEKDTQVEGGGEGGEGEAAEGAGEGEEGEGSEESDNSNNNAMMTMSLTVGVGISLLFINIIAFAVVSYHKEKDRYLIQVTNCFCC